MKTKNTNRAGFTLVEIMIVVAIIGLLAAIAIPNFVRARKQSQTSICINNLRIIDAAKQQWATENKVAETATPDSLTVGNYINKGFPTCPALGIYTINAVNVDPTCSLAAGDSAGNFKHVLPAP